MVLSRIGSLPMKWRWQQFHCRCVEMTGVVATRYQFVCHLLTVICQGSHLPPQRSAMAKPTRDKWMGETVILITNPDPNPSRTPYDLLKPFAVVYLCDGRSLRWWTSTLGE